MSDVKRILAISGSLRKASLNKQLLQAAEPLFGEGYQINWASIADIPHYNSDLDGEDKPQAAARFIEQVSSAEALMIATPEYNYGVPGVLKNALDWASRPAFKSCLAHKPVLLMSVSPGPAGGVRAQGQLKQILSGTLSDVYPAPEFAVSNAMESFLMAS